MRSRTKNLGVLSCLLILAAASSYAGELVPGSAAPALSVSKWLNGDEVKSFDKGKIYVVECWATWCGPCIGVIPHLSEMNTKYKDKNVVFIGMNVWERDPSAVEPFVKRMGPKMNYRVAMDDGGKTADAWLAAAGQNGIPCSFLVDKEGKVAWIGHPMSLEPVLAKVVAGTYDVKKQAEIDKKKAVIQRKMQTAAEENDADKFIAAADEMIALEPESAVELGVAKGSVLLQSKKYAEGYALLSKLADNEIKDNADALNAVAWGILATDNIEKRDFDLALKCAQRADELTKHENGPILDTLARAYFDKGQIDKAIETQTRAVEKSKGEQIEEELKATLKRYKEAKK
ncbi:MAG TPA: redoxin family protein [Planctomycetota bacterium]|nr:redoxin family protein [Planctomycetota bacterium]